MKFFKPLATFCSCTFWFVSDQVGNQNLGFLMMQFIYEQRREQTVFFCICENKDADHQLRGNREADQRLCFRYMDSTISLLPKYKISSLHSSSVAVQPGLCGTWLETPKTGFLTMRLIRGSINNFVNFLYQTSNAKRLS